MSANMDLALAFEDSPPFKLTIAQHQALDEAGAFEEQHGRDDAHRRDPAAQCARSGYRRDDAPETEAGLLPLEGVQILMEVARTTLRKDMTVKRDIYARAGVPEYWVVDVKKAEVHRYADPQDGAYRQEPAIPLAGPLASPTITGLLIDGGGIL